MNIAIRADGSPFIGMGHVMRCLSLAAALRQSGHDVEFFSRFEPGLSRIREQGFAVRQVAGGLPDGAGKEYEPAQDTDAVCKLLAGGCYDGLVTDSYRLDADYFRQVRRLVKASFYIDDLNRFPVTVDAVINGNINADIAGELCGIFIAVVANVDELVEGVGNALADGIVGFGAESEGDEFKAAFVVQFK